MAKRKRDGQKPTPNKHLHARISYLYKAAAYLQSPIPSSYSGQSSSDILQSMTNRSSVGSDSVQIPAKRHETSADVQQTEEDETNVRTSVDDSSTSRPSVVNRNGGDQRLLLSQIRPIMQKGRIQASHIIKRNVCKKCNTLLTEGSTCTTSIENASRGRKKPWADVSVVTCATCNSVKRFPVGAKRQARKKDRDAQRRAQPGKTLR